MSVQVPNELQRLSPYQCRTLIDKLWAWPSTTLTSERTNVTRGGIAKNWHTGGLLGLLHHGPPAPQDGQNPVKLETYAFQWYKSLWQRLYRMLCASFCDLGGRERMSWGSSRNILQQSALTFQAYFCSNLFEESLAGEDSHARHWFSNLISNPLGPSHLPIIYEHRAFFEHQLILTDASFVVLRRWWPLITEPNRKHGQLVVMSKFKLMESFISYTSVCTIFRGAECYHAFGIVQSSPCHVSKTLADGCTNHENRYVLSFQLLLHCPHIRNNPQSSTPRSIGNLDCVAPCSKQIWSPKPHIKTDQSITVWGKNLTTDEASAQQQVSLLWRRRLRTGSAASKASAIDTLRFRMVGKDKYNAHKYPKSWINGVIRNKIAVLVWIRKLFSRDNVVLGCYGSVGTKLADVDWFSYPKTYDN